MTNHMSCFGTALVCLLLTFAKVSGNATEDSRKPIWNVAHMVNARYQVDEYLGRGANSIEFDVTFDNDGTARYTYHGIPCDCFRTCHRYESFNAYLDYMRRLTTPDDSLFRNELVMLFLDLKLRRLSYSAQLRAGESIAEKLLRRYLKPEGTSGGRAYILLSLPSIENIEVVNSFRRTLQIHNATHYEDRIGYDFSGNEDLDQIGSVLRSARLTKHVWQGDGITNCLPRGTSRLLDAMRRRDGKRHSNKVYWWTVDKYSTIRRTLTLGVDALITNYPERLKYVLNEGEFSNQLRLAGIEDNPWITYSPKSAGIASRSGRYRSLPSSGSESQEEEEEILYNS